MAPVLHRTCGYCGSAFNTVSGCGTHQRICERKRPWQREHYKKTGSWPKRKEGKAHRPMRAKWRR